MLNALLMALLAAGLMTEAPMGAPVQSSHAQAIPPAQTASPDRDVVVTARKPVKAGEAHAFARTASAAIDGQLAKFDDPACPMAFGFPPRMAAQIAARIRDVASSAGVPLAREGCKGNVLVIAADDGAALVGDMRRLDSTLIRNLPTSEIDALIKSREPVHGWSFTQLQDPDGNTPSVPIGGGMPILVVNSDVSHTMASTQQVIGKAVVVIDWPAMMGKSAIQIADYAAMRTLARTRPVKGDGAVGTILALFDGAVTPPAEITDADLAYLHALDATPGNRFAHTQIGEITAQVRAASAVPPAPAKP